MGTLNCHFVYLPNDMGTHQYRLFTIWEHLAVAMGTQFVYHMGTLNCRSDDSVAATGLG